MWAEVELPADVDWQTKADAASTRDIRGKVPIGGHYRFKTNKMQGGALLIGGAMRVVRVLSDEDVDTILEQAGEGAEAAAEHRGDLRYAVRAKGKVQTDTPEFKRWFGKIKVVDAKGHALVVYHGGRKFNTFDSSAPRLMLTHPSPFFFFTSKKENAEFYEDGEVKSVYLSIQNPKIYTRRITIGSRRMAVAHTHWRKRRTWRTSKRIPTGTA